MSIRQRVFGCAVLFLLLLPVLFFPFGEDHFVFLRGGQVLLDGGLIYVDFYDVKPPLIFYLYAAAASVFGASEFGVRLFDFLWQGATLASILYVVRSVTAEEKFAFYAAGIYALTYTTLNVPMTMQCESFAALTIPWVIYLQLHGTPSRSRTILQGAALALATALKYPLGILLPAIMLYELFVRELPWKQLLNRWLLRGAGYVLFLAVFLFPFFHPEVLNGYRRISEYLIFYASNPPLSFAFVRDGIKNIAGYFGDHYSLALLACIGSACLYAASRASSEGKNNRINRLLGLLTVMSIFLLLSVIVERKFMPYHFSRMYVPLAVIAGIGAEKLRKRIAGAFWHSSSQIRLTAALCCGVMLIWSPLPRWIATLPYMANSLTGHPEATDARMQRSNPIAVPREDIRRIERYIRLQPQQGRVVAMSMIATELYYFLNEKEFSKFIGTTLIYSVSPVRGMKAELLAEAEKAQWLIIQKNDYYPTLFGHGHSSSEMILSDTTAAAFLHRNFVKATTIGEFDIYSRIPLQAIP